MRWIWINKLLQYSKHHTNKSSSSLHVAYSITLKTKLVR
jgi:hypothetical protein